ncbi:MAG: condensation domain-containing protein, partial [Myxococcota bacterium]
DSGGTADPDEPLRGVDDPFINRPFDLRSGPLWRVQLVRVAARHHILYLNAHHIICDGWSMGVLARDLADLYSERPLSALSIQYTDFARWQRRRDSDEAAAELVAYWRDHLRGAPPVSPLPTDFERPPVQSFAGAEYQFTIDRAATAGLRAMAGREHCTLYVVLLTLFKVLIAHASGGRDIVVGTDVAGRDHPATRGLIGLFVNQLVLRSDLTGDPSLSELLRRVRGTVLGGLDHQELPFHRLVEALRPARDPRHNPLFQLMFVLEDTPAAAVAMTGLQTRARALAIGGAPFDISLILSPDADALHGSLRYKTALFRPATIANLAHGYAALVRAVAAGTELRLSDLSDALTAAEHRQRTADLAELKRRGAAKFRRRRD